MNRFKEIFQGKPKRISASMPVPTTIKVHNSSPPLSPPATRQQLKCQGLCFAVTQRLPRELRDMVYEYMVTPDYIYAGTQYLSNPGDPCENDLGAPFWNVEYVGVQFKTELAEMWYRVSLFYFWDRPENHYVIDRFMAQDRWGLSIKPHEHITRVRFDVGDTRLFKKSYYNQPDPLFQEFLKNMTAPLKKMEHYHFPNYVAFTIRVHTYGTLRSQYLRGEALEMAVQQLLNVLIKWKADGHRFTIQWSEINNWEFDSRSSDLVTEVWCAQIEEALRTME